MNTETIIRLVMLALASFTASHGVLAQGPLTPPGAPAPTLKTLDQLEARKPISGVPFTINVAGSYYLTRSFALPSGNAITISADNVTLDLNGFTLSSTASPASGIAISLPDSRRNIIIRNGHIRGATTFSGSTFTPGGFLDGVRVASAGANIRVTGLSVFGVAQTGINLGGGTTFVAERCVAQVCGTFGIGAYQVRECAAEFCGTYGILATDSVIDSTGSSAGTGQFNDGIEANTVINSIGVAVAGAGIRCKTATHCVGTSNTGPGISAIGTASFCHGTSNGSLVIAADIATGCTVSPLGGLVNSPKKSLGTP